MALYTVRSVTRTGAAITRVAVALTDTISGSDIGSDGVILDVNNASGGSINVTVGDPGRTPIGNVGTAVAVAVPAAGQRQIFVGPQNVDPASGVATITYSAITSVTAEVYRY